MTTQDEFEKDIIRWFLYGTNKALEQQQQQQQQQQEEQQQQQEEEERKEDSAQVTPVTPAPEQQHVSLKIN
jgi:hypothetical protein